MDRARAILQSTAVHRSADQLVMRPWQGGQLGSAGIDPTQFQPGQYARAIRGGMYTSAQPSSWRPDRVYDTGVIQPFPIQNQNPVEMARHTIDPFIGDVRGRGPAVAGWPGPAVVYRAYTPATALTNYPGQGTSPTSTYCTTCTYSPSVSVERRGTVPAAAPAAAPTNRSAFGFYRP